MKKMFYLLSLLTFLMFSCDSSIEDSPKNKKLNDRIIPAPPRVSSLTYSIEGEANSGTLIAKLEGSDDLLEDSPTFVTHGYAVVVTATANKGFKIEKWIKNGSVVKDAVNKPTYSCKALGDTDVKVKITRE